MLLALLAHSLAVCPALLLLALLAHFVTVRPASCCRRYCVEAIAADIKESLCRVNESAFYEDSNQPVATVSYELPDGHMITIGADRFKMPELMFQPALLSSYPGVLAGTVKESKKQPVNGHDCRPRCIDCLLLCASIIIVFINTGR